MAPRPSTIDMLPQNVRDSVHAWLNDPSVSQLDTVDRTNQLIDAINAARPDEDALPHVSRSGVNRYAKRVQQIGEKMRQSREVAQQLMAGVQWDDSSKVDRFIQEAVRTLVFDVSSTMAEGDDPVSPKLLAQLALTVKRLQEAGVISDKREREIREDERQAAADAVETEAKAQGLSDSTIAAIKQKLLGV